MRSHGSKRTFAGGIAILLAIATVALAAGGSLDSTFGTGGVASIDAGGFMNDLVAQADGRIIEGGRSDTGRTNEIGGAISEWAIRRFDAGGNLDGGFGAGGLVKLFGDAGGDSAWDLAVDVSGCVVAVGNTTVKTVTVTGTGKKQKTTYKFTRYATLARLNANGSLDTSFGTGGVVRGVVAGATGSDANAVIVQPDGRILVAGSATFGTWPFGARPFVARYLGNGSLDTTFGTLGVTLDTRRTDPPSAAGAVVKSAAIQSTGHVVVALVHQPNLWIVARYDANGAIDPTFPMTATTNPNQIIGIAVDRFDRIVATGQTKTASSYDIRVARYAADGSADTSFGVGGVMTINAFEGTGPEMAVGDARFQPADDKIVFAASVRPVAGSQATAIRLADAGALDETYGPGGLGALIDIGSFPAGIQVALAPDGGHLLGGFGSPYWFVAKYTAD